MFKLKHEPLARRSQFFMNLIICGFRRIHVIFTCIPNGKINGTLYMVKLYIT